MSFERCVQFLSFATLVNYIVFLETVPIKFKFKYLPSTSVYVQYYPVQCMMEQSSVNICTLFTVDSELCTVYSWQWTVNCVECTIQYSCSRVKTLAYITPPVAGPGAWHLHTLQSSPSTLPSPPLLSSPLTSSPPLWPPLISSPKSLLAGLVKITGHCQSLSMPLF